MKNLLLFIISALLLSISWPTYGIVYFLFFALVPMLLAEHDISIFSKKKFKGLRIFLLSMLTFLIWNIVTTGWLYHALNPDGSHSLTAVILPVTANSILYSLVILAYHYYKKKEGTYWGMAFLLVIWMVFEKIHLNWELTWPWLNLGNAFSENPEIIQWYDILGATGGTFWILVSNLAIFFTIRIWQASRSTKKLIFNSSITLAWILIPITYSLIQYHNYKVKSIGEVNVLLLQPELDPYNEKYQRDSLQILNDLLNLAEIHSTGKIDYYIAPETALPGRGSISESSLENSLILNKIDQFLRTKPKSIFISGISSHEIFRSSDAPKNAYQISPDLKVESYNSAIQLIPNQKTEIYHKGKLVPGVEIFPYMSILKPILGDAMLNFGGAVISLGSSTERRVFTNPFNKGIAAPIICYESIYGEFVTDYVKNGANFLTIETNDSWWGVTQGHQQLLSYARIRAIETRREIARSANSGISAHINSRGDIEEKTLYGDQTALFAKIKLLDKETIYVKYGDSITRLCFILLGFFVFYTLLKEIQNLIKRPKQR